MKNIQILIIIALGGIEVSIDEINDAFPYGITDAQLKLMCKLLDTDIEFNSWKIKESFDFIYGIGVDDIMFLKAINSAEYININEYKHLIFLFKDYVDVILQYQADDLYKCDVEISFEIINDTVKFEYECTKEQVIEACDKNGLDFFKAVFLKSENNLSK